MNAPPRVLDLRATPPAGADLDRVVEHLRTGGLVAYPTETVYGFGAACTPEGVARVAALKRREVEKPLLVLVRDAGEVARLAWTEEARELAGIFWPGSVTLVLRDPLGIFPPGIRSPAGSVAVRVSPHPLVQALLERLDAPLTSTSANAPGTEPARSGDEALAAARALDAGAEMLVLDAGTLPGSGPSTIVDCTGARPVVVREGTVPLHRLRCALPDIHGS
jgi:L-threonylcarbamoyladenylate synthase